MKKLSLVIPCYLNELNIPHTGKALEDLYESLRGLYEVQITLVDDGSTDKTYAEIQKFQKVHPDYVKSIRLARNFGSSAAVMAGLSKNESDLYVFMSADLQDPPELIPQMASHHEKGYKVIIGSRTQRPERGLSKMLSSLFHYLMTRYALPQAPKGGFDLVMFDRLVRDQLIQMDEPNLYLPYAITWFGYPTVFIPYARRKREHGKSSWTLAKKIKAFIDSFVGFSFMPIRLISTFGFAYATFAFIYSAMIVYQKFTQPNVVQGWSSIMIVLMLTSSLLFLSLGILGEYIWRILESTRKRPTFVIDQFIDSNRNH